MTIIEVFSIADKRSHGKAIQYLLITTMISISPLYLTLIAFNLIDVPMKIINFIEHGEAAICAIGILLWSGILVARELKPPFAHRLFFQTLVFILWASSIAIYITIRIAVAYSQPLKHSSLCTSSLFLLVFSLIFAWFVVLIDAVRESLDPQTERNKQINHLAKDFEEIKDE